MTKHSNRAASPYGRGLNFLNFVRPADTSGVRIAAAAIVAALSFSGAAHAQNTVITADKMVDVLTGKVVEYPAVFVGADGRITNIADARTVKWGSDVKHIDLSGKTILPGLIDMHVHGGFGVSFGLGDLAADLAKYSTWAAGNAETGRSTGLDPRQAGAR